MGMNDDKRCDCVSNAVFSSAYQKHEESQRKLLHQLCLLLYTCRSLPHPLLRLTTSAMILH